MTATLVERPKKNEHHEYYARYISLVPDGDIVATLERQIDESLKQFSSLDEEGAKYRYASGKWSIKETVGHLIDTERIFAYRALRIGRGDTTPLPGFDQEPYTRVARFDGRPWKDLLEEWRLVRLANVSLFRSFDDAAWQRVGTANDSSVSVRALAWIIAGHERHHMRLVREKYLGRG